MTQPVSLEAFGLSKEFGYMQHRDPVTSLSSANGAWMRWRVICQSI